MRIVQIDLRTGEEDTVILTPGEHYDALWDPYICGDFVAVPLRGRPQPRPRAEAVLLINWRKQSAVLLGLPEANVASPLS